MSAKCFVNIRLHYPMLPYRIRYETCEDMKTPCKVPGVAPPILAVKAGSIPAVPTDSTAMLDVLHAEVEPVYTAV